MARRRMAKKADRMAELSAEAGVQRPLCLFIYQNRDGGVERNMANLAQGFADRGIAVDLLVSDATGPFMQPLAAGVRVIGLGKGSKRTVIAALARYLRQNRPRAVITGKPSDDRFILRARRRAGVESRCFFGAGTAISRQIEERGFHPLRRRWKAWRRGRLYRQADGIIATSNWVARDIARLSGLPVERITVIGNPVVTPQLHPLAAEPVEHPFFCPGAAPVIIAAGRLSHEKDFSTLLRAFGLLRRSHDARLLILGEGAQRPMLEQLVAQLGLDGAVSLPGFVANPYAWMARARLFVLSSLWEGFGNVLVEAMAVGTPVVSTDCPGGPREILHDGAYGPLVPVGDAVALSRAMARMLDQPTAAGLLREAAQSYSVEACVARYLRLLEG